VAKCGESVGGAAVYGGGEWWVGCWRVGEQYGSDVFERDVLWRSGGEGVDENG